MFLIALENFVFFSTLLALVAFGFAWFAHKLSVSSLWKIRPDVLTRIYTAALIVPPVSAFWLVAAALLPQWWLGEARPRLMLHTRLLFMNFIYSAT